MTQHGEDKHVERRPRDSSRGFGAFTRLYRDAAPYLALGVQLAATVVIMFYVGKWADEYFGTQPWLMLTGLTLGAAAGFYNFFKTVVDLGRRGSPEEKRGAETDQEER